MEIHKQVTVGLVCSSFKDSHHILPSPQKRLRHQCSYSYLVSWIFEGHDAMNVA